MLITVSKGSAGGVSSLQEALDSIPSQHSSAVTIRIKPGVYEEKITVGQHLPPILLLGEDTESTILTWSDNAHTLGTDGEPLGTFRSGTLNVFASGFTAENLTVRNASGPGTGQAVAAFIDADQAVFRRVRLLGDQDTLYTGQGRQYYDNCYIEGDVDYIFGAATALFDRCELHNKRSRGYITAASTPEGTRFGYVFLDCRITGERESAMSIWAALGAPLPMLLLSAPRWMLRLRRKAGITGDSRTGRQPAVMRNLPAADRELVPGQECHGPGS